MIVDRRALDEAMGGLSIWGVMCVRNEAERYLADVLEWHLGFLDGVFVFDDQSTDDTVAVAQGFDDVLVEVRPDDVPSFLEHEGEFRQAGWEAFETSFQPMVGDWVLAIDADELFVAPGDERVALLDIIRFAEHDKTRAAKLRIEEIFAVDGATPMQRIDGHWKSIGGIRLTKYDPTFKFANRKLGGGSVPVPRGPVLDATDWSGGLQHFGYVRAEDRRQKYERYTAFAGHNTDHVRSIVKAPQLKPARVSKRVLR